MPPLPTSAGAGRRFLRDRLNDWGYPSAIGEIPCLLVSELVTNAVLRTEADVGLALRLTNRRLRVTVTDQTRRVPVPRLGEADNGDIGQLSFKLVEELARDWGTESTATGQTTWFEVDLAAKDRLHWD